MLGKHSGRHAFRNQVKEMGYHLDEAELGKVFEAFKALADRKKDIYDADIEALIEGRIQDAPALWEIVGFHITTGTGALPTAAVRLRHIDGRMVEEAACGDGPVDALFKAIERITDINVSVRDYQVRSVTIGEDAQGEVQVEVEYAGCRHRGHAASTDIIEASARAFLYAINQIAQKVKPTTELADGMRVRS